MNEDVFPIEHFGRFFRCQPCQLSSRIEVNAHVLIFQDVDDASMEIADAKLPYGYEPRDKSWEMVTMVGRKGCEIQENLGESRIFRFVFLTSTSIVKSWLRYHQS